MIVLLAGSTVMTVLLVVMTIARSVTAVLIVMIVLAGSTVMTVLLVVMTIVRLVAVSTVMIVLLAGLIVMTVLLVVMMTVRSVTAVLVVTIAHAVLIVMTVHLVALIVTTVAHALQLKNVRQKCVPALVRGVRQARCPCHLNAHVKSGWMKGQHVLHVAQQVCVQRGQAVHKRADARKFVHLMA
jgi:hypothetical protein